MNIVIIEDEMLAAENLERMLFSLDNTIQVLDKIDSVRKAVQWFQKNTCDLIFMDIQLSDGVSFQIFEQIDLKIPVIFVTAYDQFAIKAFKVNSVDYLLKPIKINELSESLLKFKTLNEPQNPIRELLDYFKNPNKYQNRFMVYAGQKIITVKSSEIAYFLIREGSVFLCTHEGKENAIDYTMDKLESILDKNMFFRINRQFIVNIEAISQMHILSKSRLKLEIKPFCDIEAIVSFNNVHDFKAWLNR